MRVAYGVCVTLFAALLVARGAEGPSSFTAGNQAYEQGKFAEAAVHYRAAITNGLATEGVWFNLGNAEFRAGQLGRAIVAYRRAEQISPRDSALRANLQFVRKKATGEDEPRIAVARQLIRFATPNEWFVLASASLGLIFVTLTIAELRGGRAGRGTVFSLVLFAACLSGAAAGSYYDRNVRREGVIIAKQSAVRFGPIEVSQTAFQLNDGAEVHVADATTEWWQVRDATGRIGWAKRGDVALVSP